MKNIIIPKKTVEVPERILVPQTVTLAIEDTSNSIGELIIVFTDNSSVILRGIELSELMDKAVEKAVLSDELKSAIIKDVDTKDTST